MAQRQTFDTDAERYAARRPTYPAALFDRLAAYGDLDDGARVVEIGPGTGQATASMAERGWAVTGVELGADLAAVARRQLADFPAVELVVGAFEEWSPPPEPFDAVVCATAWHWLDPATRLRTATRVLRPRGTVAIVWTHHVAGGSQAFFTAAQDCYRRLDPETYEDGPLPEDRVPTPTDELVQSSLVTDVASHRFCVDLTYTGEEYLDLLRTYSTTIRLPAGRRAALLGCLADLIDHRFGGEITKRYTFDLVLGRASHGLPR
ncbi:SAM-dependent methyltransferase [Geodermatophilus sp. TF02-6]|nr:SAM-dependent methyltransferase [Geodermatophilus sp. TF02-6]